MTMIGLCLCTLITITSAGLQLIVNPKFIQRGSEKRFHLECRYERDKNTTLVRMSRIMIRRKMDNYPKNEYDWGELAWMNQGDQSPSGPTNSKELYGHVTTWGDKSWLGFRIKYPTKQDTCCYYRCDFEGENIRGARIIEYLYFNVTYIVPFYETMLGYIQNIARDLEELQVSTAGQFDRWKNYFNISDSFKGSRYYLSFPSKFLHKNHAQAMCQVIGGKLAMIESTEERQFLVSFVKKFPNNEFVLAGGTDFSWYANANSTYVYRIREVHRGKWEDTCFFFMKSHDFEANYYVCKERVLRKVGAYICEVKE